MASELSIYDNATQSVALKTFTYDGHGHYDVLDPASLGEKSLYVKVTIIAVLKPSALSGLLPTNPSADQIVQADFSDSGSPGGTYQDEPAHLLVDTGSWQTVIPEHIVTDTIGTAAFNPGDYPSAEVTYSSSGNGGTGVWVPMQLQFTTTDGSTAVTTIPVLVATGSDQPEMIGVGFDVGRGKASSYPDVTTANNAFLNLTQMRDGTMTRGYVIDGSGIHLGLTADDVGGGWAYQKLQPSVRLAPAGAPTDWQPSTVSGTVGGTDFPAGNLLPDTGLFNSYIEAAAALPVATDGTAVSLDLLGTRGQVGFGYSVGGTSPLVPLRGSQSPAVLTRDLSGTADTTTFVNTGEHILTGFDYMFDSTNGYVGLRQNGGAPSSDVRFGQLLSAAGTYGLPDGFGTSLPLYLAGDVQLVLAGHATLSGGLSGLGTLTIMGGILALSGAGDLKGSVVLDGTVMTLEPGDSLGDRSNVVTLRHGADLVLAQNMTIHHQLTVEGPSTLQVAAGATVTMAASLSGTSDQDLTTGGIVPATLTVSGGGTLVLSHDVQSVDTITVQGAGTTLSVSGDISGARNLVLGAGTTLKATADMQIEPILVAGNATVSVAEGATLTVSGGIMPGTGGQGRLSVVGQGTLRIADGSEIEAKVKGGHALLVDTVAGFDGANVGTFSAGDVIELSDLDAMSGGVTASYDPATGALTVTQGSRHATATLPMNLTAGHVDEFTVRRNGEGGTLIQLAPATNATGSDALRATQARAASGVTGQGVKVGVISSGFNTLGGMAQDIANGALPADTTVLIDSTGHTDDEGRSMAQLIHRIAPGASIVFANDGTDAPGMPGSGLADAINRLVAGHVQIIVDDIGVFGDLVYQPGGVVDQAIAAARSQGVVFLTSATNAGNAFYEHGFSLAQTALDGFDPLVYAYDFGGSQYRQHIHLTGNGTTDITLAWDQPSGASLYNLDFKVFRKEGDDYVLDRTVGSTLKDGGTVRVITIPHSDDNEDFYVSVVSSDKDATGTFKYIVHGQGYGYFDGNAYHNVIVDPNAGIGSGAIFGHGLHADEITVGAVGYMDAGDPKNEPFSAAGTGVFYFNAAGNRLATPQALSKPDVSGVDGVATDTSGVSDGFLGTSAAAPSVAGVVALMLQANPHLTAEQARQALKLSAHPMTGAAAGAGLVQADGAVVLATVPTLVGVSAAANAPGRTLHAGQTVTLTLTASTALTVTAGIDGKLPSLTFDDGATASLNLAASSGSTLVFRTTIAAGQGSAGLTVTGLSLNGATITNAAGVAMPGAADLSGLSGSATGLVVDTQPPPVSSSTNPLAGYAFAVAGTLALNGSTAYAYQYPGTAVDGMPDVGLTGSGAPYAYTDCSGWMAYALNSVAPLHAAVTVAAHTDPLFNGNTVKLYDPNSATDGGHGPTLTLNEAADWPWARADVLAHLFSTSDGRDGFTQIPRIADLQAGDLVAYASGIYADPFNPDSVNMPGLTLTSDTGHTMVVVGTPQLVPANLTATGLTSSGVSIADTLSPDVVAVYAVPVVDSSDVPHFHDIPGFSQPLLDDRGYATLPNDAPPGAKKGGLGTGTIWFAVDRDGKAIQTRFGEKDAFMPSQASGDTATKLVAAVRPTATIDLSTTRLVDNQLVVRVFPNAQGMVNGATYAMQEVLTGTAGLRVEGTGTLTLSSGQNSYSGGTTIDGGTLRLSAPNAAGTGTIDFAAAGGTLRVDFGVSVDNVIQGLGANSSIDLSGISYASSLELVQNGGTLRVTDGHSTQTTLHFASSEAAQDAMAAAALRDDGAGGTVLARGAEPAGLHGFLWGDSQGDLGLTAGQAYTGPVSYLEHQYFFNGADGKAVVANMSNVFIHGGDGSDAIVVQGGSNVIDGGGGSSFLVGATGTDGGHDTFFLDATQPIPIWDTIVNFHSNDMVTLWGMALPADALHWIGQDGAQGYQGATIRFGNADASVTFAGISDAAAKATIQVTSGNIAGLDYTMLIAR